MVSAPEYFFGVDVVKLQTEFTEICQMQPAAFDRRLYKAAKIHFKDLISRNAKDHINQSDRVDATDFNWLSHRGVVFSEWSINYEYLGQNFY